jgi:predicted permease
MRLDPRRRRRERDLEDEIQSHLRMAEDDRVAGGESPEQASRRARLEFGNVALAKEVTRDMWRGGWLDRIGRDVRFALRLFGRNPGFAAAAIATLALGIAANTTVFTIVDHVMFRPPPYLDGDRLVQVVGLDRRNGGGGNNLTAHVLLGWQGQGVFERLEGYGPQQLDMSGQAEPERVFGYTVTTGLFSLLGTPPALGRVFGPADGRPGDEPVVILGNQVWRSRFGASPAAVGQTILLNGDSYRVVGVMPPHFLRDDGIFLPFDLASHDTDSTISNLLALGRLPQGMSPESAQARADVLAERLNGADPLPRPRSWYLGIRPWRIVYLSDMAHDALLLLLGAVGFVLIIACVNVANLLLARAVVREREMAVRSALGASRGRLVQQGLTESVLLSFAGSALGVALAWAGVRAIAARAPTVPFVNINGVDLRIDARILVFAAVVSVLTALVFGLVPALRGSRPNLDVGLRGAAPGGGRPAGRLSSALVVAEVAFSLVLLVGAALMTRTFARLTAIAPGFNPDGVVTAMIGLPTDRYPTPASQQDFWDALSTDLSRLGGVSGVAMANGLLPVQTNINFGTVEGEGDPIRRAGPDSTSGGLIVTPAFFDVLGIPFVEGRTFSARDETNVVIVNQRLATRLWPESSAVGRRIRPHENAAWLTVVGVVGDVEMRMPVSNDRLTLQMYQPFRAASPTQPASPPPARARVSFPFRRLFVRTSDPAVLVPALKARVWALDQALPVQEIKLLQDVWNETFAPQLLVLLVMGLFSAIAVVLAAAGLFAVISQAVAHRAREIGIRVALGATRWDIFLTVMARAMALVAIGVLIGLAGAAAISRTLTALLFEVSPYDPISFAAVSAALLVVALVACWLPTRRAMAVDPAVALKAE